MAMPLSTSRRTRARTLAPARSRSKRRDVEPEPGGVPAQVVVPERPLVVEQLRVHVPEPVLAGGGLGGGRGGQGVRVDPG